MTICGWRVLCWCGVAVCLADGNARCGCNNVSRLLEFCWMLAAPVLWNRLSPEHSDTSGGDGPICVCLCQAFDHPRGIRPPHGVCIQTPYGTTYRCWFSVTGPPGDTNDTTSRPAPGAMLLRSSRLWEHRGTSAMRTACIAANGPHHKERPGSVPADHGRRSARRAAMVSSTSSAFMGRRGRAACCSRQRWRQRRLVRARVAFVPLRHDLASQLGEFR